MKKIYEKPKVYIESFEVSEFIAGNCALDVGFGKDTCNIDPVPVPDPDFPGDCFFTTKPTCTDTPSDDFVNNDGFCYNMPTDGQRYFGS